MTVEERLQQELQAHLDKMSARLPEIERILPMDQTDLLFLRMLWEKMFWREKAIANEKELSIR